MTRDDISIGRGNNCFVVTVKNGDDSYSITASDDVPCRRVVEMLMDNICQKELGITSHDIWMVISDFMVRK